MRKKIVSFLTAGALSLTLALNVSAVDLDFYEDDLGEKCTNKWGYNYFSGVDKADAKQELYDRLLDACYDLWEYDEDVPLTFIGQDTSGNDVYAYNFRTIEYSDLDLSYGEAASVYFTVRHDNPIFYYLSNSFRISGAAYSDGHVEYSLLFCVDEEYVKAADRKKYQAEIEKYLGNKADEISGLTRRYDIAKKYHDLLVEEAEYSYVTIDGKTYADTGSMAHNILGIILNGKGVCESYAKVFQLLLTYAGVDNVYVTGFGNGGGHAWNIVLMDNDKYYDFDVTFDDTGATNVYFAAGSDFFDRNHTPDTPEYVGKFFLYEIPEIPEEDYDPSDIVIHLTNDINRDGKVNLKDLLSLIRYLNGWGNDIDLEAADVYKDGKVNMKDTAKLQRLLNGFLN